MALLLPTQTVLSIENPDNSTGSVQLPDVFKAPLRPDIVRTVHRDMQKNKRQQVQVKYEQGYDTAQISWGTGRQVARIPRVPGSGTHRTGQGAFGNMCRGGGMFNPTKVWRRWHRKVNVGQKRHQLATAVSASQVPPLVLARGHKISEVPMIPTVVENKIAEITKTKDAMDLLVKIGCQEELQKVKDSKKIRQGRGKQRNRRYVMRKGPLMVYQENQDQVQKAFRNIPGVDTCCVERLNLLQLAPGGAFGRFVIYTEDQISRLGELFGSYEDGSMEKKGYVLPRSMMTNCDISRIINSTEIQSVLNPQKEQKKSYVCRKNPLKNKSVLGRLMPGEVQQKKNRQLEHKTGTVQQKVQKQRVLKNKQQSKKHGKKGKQFFKQLEGSHRLQQEQKVQAQKQKAGGEESGEDEE